MATTYGPSPVDDGVERLRAFLTTVEDLLRSVAEDPNDLIPDVLHIELAAAWTSVQPRFEVVRERLPEVAGQLEGVGLTGAELAFKMSAVDWAIEKYMRAREQMANGGKQGLAKAAGLLASVLGLIDVPLDSVPSIFGVDAIKEFKGIVEHTAEVVSQVQEDEPEGPSAETSRPPDPGKFNF